jgi:steroid delta-isomerase-like uncharacterized protein
MMRVMLEQELHSKVAENLQVVRRAWVDALSDKAIEDFVDLHSETVVMYDPTLPQPLRGRTALRNLIQNLYGMFPDYRLREERVFGQDEWVCLEAEESGTMKGAMHGPEGNTIQPTSKSFKAPSSIVCRVENGKIAEVRVYFDVLGLMAQLGLGPR